MTTREQINELLAALPESRIPFVLEFLQFLAQKQESEEWTHASLENLERCYADDEPDYQAEWNAAGTARVDS